MNIDVLKKIRMLLDSADSFNTFHDRFRIKSHQSNCDKHGYKFTTPTDRFVNFTVKTSFTSYIGYYGSSSCSTLILDTPPKLEQYFTRALTKHSELIFETMAEEMKKDAQANLGQAKDQMARVQSMLKQLETE